MSNTEENNDITEEEKQQVVEKITYYHNVALTFIDTHKKDLANIYMHHIQNASTDEDKVGVLGINMIEMEEKKNIDVAFLPAKVLPSDIINTILERQKENNENIIYFLMISQLEEKIIEIDIRTLLE